jgi:alpha-L-rhamnosidase
MTSLDTSTARAHDTDRAHPLGSARFLGTSTAGPFAARTTVTVPPDAGPVVRATLWSTSLGVHEVRVNGIPADDAVLEPGWTAYEWRLPYREVDVTTQARGGQGRIDLDVTVADGWYRGPLGWDGADARYGSVIACAVRLEVEHADGSVRVVQTDGTWEGYRPATTTATLYGGQTIDARRQDVLEPLPLEEIAVDHGTLVAATGPRVRRQQVLAPVAIRRTDHGTHLVDFGQNLVGWLRLSVTGPRGTTIVARHAEVLSGGEIATAPLRTAAATDTFVLSGEADVFEPTMTFHGFRYAELTGWPGDPTAQDVQAVVVHSDLRPTLSFSSSDPLLDRFVENVLWGQRGNFLSVPSDCPQRDERMGWTGDIAVFAPTAAYQFDVAEFLSSWLVDLDLEIRGTAERAMPFVVPNPFKYGRPGGPDWFFDPKPTAIWGDAAVWVPHALWRAYGDRAALAAQYPAAVLHLESVVARLSPDGLWDTGFQFGDWLDPDAPADNPAAAKASPAVVALACLHRSARFAAEMAAALDEPEDAARWTDLARRTRKAFARHYVRDERIESDCVTVYALAIHFGLLDPEQTRWAAARLAELVRASGHRIDSGFAGTPYLTWALSEHGYVDDAYALMLRTECPSWLYPVTMGATTVWERWDSMLPDGSLHPGDMTSFNHYALGSVADWLYLVVAGVRAGEPGFARVLVAPRPTRALGHVSLAFDSRAGRIAVHWQIDGDRFELTTTIPDGVPAEIRLPDGSSTQVTGGTHSLACTMPA